jgi:ParB family chromosome partitioning protein
MGHARALLAIENPAQQKAMAQKIIAENLTVRDIERTAQTEPSAKSGKKKSRETNNNNENDPDVVKQMENLRYRFGTMVNILRSSAEKGKIEIHFYTMSDMNRILDLLLNK